MKKENVNKEKKSKEKKKNNGLLFFLIILLVVIVVVTVVININNDNNDEKEKIPEDYVTETDEGIKVNTNSKLNEAKLVDGLLISNIQLTEKDGMTTLLADVTNKTEEKTEFKKLKITLLDENGEDIAVMTAFVGEIEPEKSTQLNASTTSNYIKAYDFKVTVD